MAVNDGLSSGLRDLLEHTRTVLSALEPVAEATEDPPRPGRLMSIALRLRGVNLFQGYRGRVDAYEALLTSARQTIADWLGTVDRLPDEDRAELERLGLHAAPIRAALTDSVMLDSPAYSDLESRPPDPDSGQRFLLAVRTELERFAHVLTTSGTRPYR